MSRPHSRRYCSGCNRWQMHKPVQVGENTGWECHVCGETHHGVIRGP